MTPTLPVQDLTQNVQPDDVIVYHTHGFRNYVGTNKLHIDPNCTHLLNWRPHHLDGKTIMKNNYSKNIASGSIMCKTCSKSNEVSK